MSAKTSDAVGSNPRSDFEKDGRLKNDPLGIARRGPIREEHVFNGERMVSQSEFKASSRNPGGGGTGF